MKKINNLSSRGFEIDGQYYVNFKSPVVIGAIKDILFLPKRQSEFLKEKEEDLEKIRTEKSVFFEKMSISTKEEEQKEYLKHFKNIVSKEKKNTEEGERKIKILKPKIVRCRIVGFSDKGYIVEPIKKPKWL